MHKSQVPKKELERPLFNITKYQKYGIAKKQSRPEPGFTKAHRAANEYSERCYSANLIDFNKSLYAFARSKIEEPSTSNLERRAWRKTARILESFFTRETLQDSPFCHRARAARSQRQSYKFCYVKPRVQ